MRSLTAYVRNGSITDGGAASAGKLRAVDISLNIKERYTIWSGLFGGFFLALAYFGADQSQVQRYLAGDSVSASRNIGPTETNMFKLPVRLIGYPSISLLLTWSPPAGPLALPQKPDSRAVGAPGAILTSIDVKKHSEKRSAIKGTGRTMGHRCSAALRTEAGSSQFRMGKMLLKRAYCSLWISY